MDEDDTGAPPESMAEEFGGAMGREDGDMDMADGDAGDEFDAGGGDDDDDGQPDTDVFEPVKYERSGTDVLPWRHVHVDVGRAGFTEAGFQSLEEIPAGSYDIVKLPNGGTVIKLRSQSQPSSSAAAAAAATAAGHAAQPGSAQPLTKAERRNAAAAAVAATKAAAATTVTGATADAVVAKPPATKAERRAAAAAAAAAATPAADGAAGTAAGAGAKPPTPKAERRAAAKAARAAAACAAGDAAATGSKKRKRVEAADAGASAGDDAAAPAPAPKQKHAPHARVAPSQRPPLALEAVAAEWGVFSLHPSLLAAIARLGFRAPTPIQRLALPAALTAYKDVIGAAETGSGKTLAYGLPILQRLLERRERLGMDAVAGSSSGGGGSGGGGGARRGGAFRYLPALILAPTRELAMQVADHLAALAEGTPLRVVAIVGGLSSEKQARLLRGRPDVVVATPGRLWDLASHGTGAAAAATTAASGSSSGGGGKTGNSAGAVGAEFLSGLGGLQFLVLDEADRLAEKGHYDALNAILAATQAPPPPSSAAGAAADALFDGLFPGNLDDALDPVAERILRDKAVRQRAHAQAQAAAAAAAAAPTVAPRAGQVSARHAEEDDEEEEEGEDDEGGEEEEASPASAAGAAGSGGASFTLFDAPAHYRRQTFLYSATLGLSTAQSAKDAAAALLSAKASQHASAAAASNAASGGIGGGLPAKLGKKAMRKALAAARALTPVEALMARVGLLGKPAVIRVSKSGGGEGEGGEEVEGAEAHEGADADADADADTRALVRGALPATSVALPPGLRLARLTCGPGTKDARLYHFLLRFPGRSLVFVNSIGTLKRLAGLLGALRLPLHTLHASMQQRQRLKHLDQFRADARGVLVCTDVAARGLDIPHVGLVLHYSLPASAEVFVHRCGRTARALSAGLAVALVSAEDQRAYSRILSVLGLAGVGLPEFPLDDGPYERRLSSRIALARRICDAASAANKLSSSQHRLLSMAAAAGLELDDATAAEEGLPTVGGAAAGGGAGSAGSKQQKQQQRGGAGGKAKSPAAAAVAAAAADAEHEAASEGEEGVGGRRAGEQAEAASDAAWRAKMQARAASALRRELDVLLAQPLAPAGMSHRYVATVNPLLVGGGGGGGSGKAAVAAAAAAARASHPLQDRVTLLAPAGRFEHEPLGGVDEEDDEEEEEEDGEEGEGEEEAPSQQQQRRRSSSSSQAPSAAFPAAQRSGSALVAPRVHVAQLDIDATGSGAGVGSSSDGGAGRRHGFGGIIPVHRLRQTAAAAAAAATAASASTGAGSEAMAMLAAQGRKTTLGVPLLAKAMLAKQQARKREDKRGVAGGASSRGGGRAGGRGGGGGGGRGRVGHARGRGRGGRGGSAPGRGR